MSKVYLDITTRVIVDTDLTSVGDIVDSLDYSFYGADENVEVLETEITNFNVVDSK